MMSEGKPPQEQTTETEENKAAVEEGAGDGGDEDILEDPSHNPEDEDLERYRGG
jgi:hypothetical protein